MMNFHARYVLCDSIIPQKTFYIGISNYLLDLPLGKTRVFILTGPAIYPQTELHAPQYLFVRSYNKQQRSGVIISNFTQKKDFLSFITTKCSWG